MLLAPGDVFYLLSETPTMSARWATAMEVKHRPPSRMAIDELRRHIAARQPLVPWSSWRIHLPRHRIGRHRWVDAAPLPLDQMVLHERRVDDVDIEPFMAQLLEEPLGLSLPPWRVRLVDLANGRQFIVLDSHHAFAGGFTSMEMITRFFADVPEPPSAPSFVPPRRVDLRDHVADAAWRVAVAAYRTASRLRPASRLAPARAGEPLVGPIGRGRTIRFERIADDRVKTLSQAYGAGATRVVIALLACSLDELGPADAEGRAQSLRALFPRGTQEGDVAAAGNASRGTFLDLPLRVAPAKRLEGILESLAADVPAVGADADLTLSFQLPMPDLQVGDHALRWLGSTGPLRMGASPVTRLTVLVQHYDGAYQLMFTADREGLGHHLPGIAARLHAAVDEFERNALVSV